MKVELSPKHRTTLSKYVRFIWVSLSKLTFFYLFYFTNRVQNRKSYDQRRNKPQYFNIHFYPLELAFEPLMFEFISPTLSF